jgi:hypothetical protein
MSMGYSFATRHALPGRATQYAARFALAFAIVFAFASIANAQSVCLPAPRLLTTRPMGGQVGTVVEVVITGENIDDLESLSFSHPGLSAQPKRNEAGEVVPLQFVVTIAPDCPPGLYEARVLTRLGVSSSRVFSVGPFPEMSAAGGNTSVEQALALPLGTVCNASMTSQAADHYAIELAAGQRIIVECAARGIDSKLTPVLILADALGNDLQAERRGGRIDYTAAEAGKYIVKVHDLTFNGGPQHFYRLVARTAAAGETLPRLPSTIAVNAFSWPPTGLAAVAATLEAEPTDPSTITPQPSTLPCDIAGRFYPAADVDIFEFSAKKGEVWWVEVASERLGRPCDPAVVVQRVVREGETETLVDVVELSDIPSPVKVSSNGYAYDGPPYNAGTADLNGKVEIPEDGTYRLQITDLFGGTRSDPDNEYRLIVRQAAPDFAIVGWPLHMELRNGDRNALTKPIALRGGATMPFEVVVIRRDGFDGEIEIVLESLPPGVTATGLKIAPGKSRGILLLTADQNAPRGLTDAVFQGRATINGAAVSRPGRMAEMAWPIPDAWHEIPRPRLVSSVPVSVCGHEFAPLSIRPAEAKVWEVTVGTSLTIPLVHTRRCEFSGAAISLRTFGEGFEHNAAFDAPLDQENSAAVLDLAKLGTPPGEYTIAFYGGAVAKFRERVEEIAPAEAALQEAQAFAATAAAETIVAMTMLETATEEQKPALSEAAQAATAKQQAADAAVAAAQQKLTEATKRAEPRDIVDIIVSEPIRIRVLPAEVAQP